MPHAPASRILTAAEAAVWRDSLAALGKRVVFTNGCFDLLHAGHVRYLNDARACGDALIVGLNSDASVASLKGPGRPLNTEGDRAEVVGALRSVDAVVIFSESRATGLIETIRPHVYAKGGDYTIASLNPEERAALEASGTEIAILPLVPGRSTTNTINAMAANRDAGKPTTVRLGILGSGRGTNLIGILSAMGSQILDAEIAVVISDVDQSGILSIAALHGLPNAYVDPGSHPNRMHDAAQKEIRDRLRSAGVDIVVLCGFMRILKQPVFSTFEGRVVNSHPSLLPKYPGLAAWKQALDAGERETGCTIHLVDAGIDTGAILKQQKVPILPGDSPGQLHRRIQEAENALYPAAISELWEKIAR